VQHIIMPPQDIIIGMPPDIIDIMRLQDSMNMSLSMPSIGFISHTMPWSVMVHFIAPIIIMGIIIGMPPIIGIMGFIMPPIMGFIIGIMPPIIGIMLFIIGIMFIAGFISLSKSSILFFQCLMIFEIYYLTISLNRE
jgi:hypothetical protein